jgi:hypothetical protein
VTTRIIHFTPLHSSVYPSSVQNDENAKISPTDQEQGRQNYNLIN